MIRIDSLIVRALARALDARYRGQPVRGLRLDPATRVATFSFRAESLRFVLDPSAPSIFVRAGRPERTDSVLPSGVRVRAVRALPDERILEWTFHGEDEAVPAVFVEWLTNRLNALVVGPDQRVRAVLSPREGERRTLTAGSPYALPPATMRRGFDTAIGPTAFAEVLASLPPVERERAFIRAFAYASPLNAASILGPALEDASSDALDDACARYLTVVDPEHSSPCVFAGRDGPQPYPVLLPGIRCTPTEDLFAAFAAAGTDAPFDPVQPALERLRREGKRVESRLRRLREEAVGAAAEAALLRHHAGLLLSQPQRAPRGTETATLNDFEGGTIQISLDPALGAPENAERLYENARKRDRAAARIPALLARAEREAERLRELETRLDAGAIRPDEVLPRAPVATASTQARALPYKRFRTSGGLEVRVGRGSRANDDLTFHHARPDDVWLHARDVGGAHVVLRWESRDTNPPASDLREAAVLAALHSKARTSGVVPVDWTRRKYVRKPRKAPPGRVMVDRVKTIFVEPDTTLAEKLRDAE
jgi:hypothetical protein